VIRRCLVVLVIALTACGGGSSSSAPTTTTSTAVAPRRSPGCGTTTAGSTSLVERTIESGGVTRSYLLSVPAAHDGRTPLPLVVELHGLAEGNAIAAKTSRFGELGAKEGFITVFPQGTGAPVQWNIRLVDDNRDVAFLGTLLDTLERDLCIDLRRVYATGLSDGALMSSIVGCTMADRFAAIAPVAGVQHPDGCTPSRPVPVLAFHGTADPILLFNGGLGDLVGALQGKPMAPPSTPVDLHGAGYPKAAADWAATDGCDAAHDRRRSAHVIERRWSCPKGGEVRFEIVEGGGHTWPGSALSETLANITGATTREIDATHEIWSFFRRHALP
jgi:polyhydroxybutyrate depolymerase